MEKTYKMWHVLVAFVLGGVIVGGISFVPSFGTKGFFQKNVGEEAVSEEAGGGDVQGNEEVESGAGGEGSTGVSVDNDAAMEAGGESASGGISRQAGGGADAGAVGGAESETGLKDGGFDNEATAGITREAEGGVDAGAPAKIDNCSNIDAKVAVAQKNLDEAMANYSKEVQAEAYEDFVNVLKKKNDCKK